MTVEKLADSGIGLYQLISFYEGATKLFVGGLHGRGATSTAPILEELINTYEGGACTGVSIIVPSLVKNSKYLQVISQDHSPSETYHFRRPPPPQSLLTPNPTS